MNAPGQPEKDTQLFGKSKAVYDYREAFSNPHGEAVLRHLIKTYHVMKPGFVMGDSHASAYNEGQRSVVLFIMRLAKKDWNVLFQELKRTVNYEDSQPIEPPPHT